MIDFTNCKELFSNYTGSEKKKKIIFKDKIHMLKFPDPVKEKNKPIFYMNNTISEYLGCKIFQSIGTNVQEVILGAYRESSTTTKKEKFVVACKDFTDATHRLIEFSSLANSITSSDKHFTTNIEDVYFVIENIAIECDKIELIKNFWDMFVIDTLLGNTDRHLSNFGFLECDNKINFAPIYDCGSTLHALLSDEEMALYLNDSNLFKNETYNIYPIYRYKEKKLTYKQFYDLGLEDLNSAVKRVVPKIDLEKINNIIDDTPFISNLKKTFLKESIKIRKEQILDKAYKVLTK